MRHPFDIRIQRTDMFYALSIDVADGFELAVRKTFEVANQERSPVTASDHPDCDWFLHIFGADSARLCKIVVGERGPFGVASAKVCKISAAERGLSSCRLRRAASWDSKSCPARAPRVLSMIFRSSRHDMFWR